MIIQIERPTSQRPEPTQAEHAATPTKNLYIKTWGCQMNLYDSKRMEDVLRPLGYTSVAAPDDADFIILNTCHIREKATEKVFSELGRLKKHKDRRAETGKQTMIAVAGCVAQAEGSVITDRAKYVDLVFGPQAYHQLPEMVAQLDGTTRVINTNFPVESKFDLLPQTETAPSPAVAHIAIQEGCDKFCSFCVVPYTRGAEFSRPVTQLLTEVKNLVGVGAKEIQLLGQNVNAYHGMGPDGREWSLGRLLFALAEIDGLQRIRYVTSHPKDMHDELYAAHAQIDILMPYLHLPVQSGSNNVLSIMNRKHDRDEYFRAIDNMRKARPDIAFSSDFIVGHPGETDADFADTMDLIRHVGFASAYSFKYSSRPGTPAAAAKGQVHEAIKDARLQELQAVLTKQHEAFNEQFIDRTVPILFERQGQKTGQFTGRSPWLQSTYVAGSDSLIGQTINVTINSASATALSGTIPTTGEHA